MSSLPKTIIVSSVEYKIREVNKIYDREAGECKGMTYGNTKRIDIEKSMIPSEKSVIVLHEILHSIFNEYNIRIPFDIEEDVVSHMAPALHNLLVDNPDLMDYFTKEILDIREKKYNKLK